MKFELLNFVWTGFLSSKSQFGRKRYHVPFKKNLLCLGFQNPYLRKFIQCQDKAFLDKASVQRNETGGKVGCGQTMSLIFKRAIISLVVCKNFKCYIKVKIQQLFFLYNPSYSWIKCMATLYFENIVITLKKPLIDKQGFTKLQPTSIVTVPFDLLLSQSSMSGLKEKFYILIIIVDNHREMSLTAGQETQNYY